MYMQIVPPQRLKTELDKCTPVEIIDLQEPHKYAHSHIPCAMNVPVEEFDNGFEQHLKDKDAVVVLYGEFDELGKGTKAAEKLEAAGYTKVGRLEGGLMGWKEAGYPTEGGIES